MSAVTLRPATIDDAFAVNALALEASQYHYALAPQTFAPPSAESAAHGPNLNNLPSDAFVWVAEDQNALVGFIFAEAAHEEREFLQAVRYVRISMVAVSENRRGQGIGRRLVAAAEEWAGQLGYTEARLNVWSVNARAGELYEELGYETMSLAMRKVLKK